MMYMFRGGDNLKLNYIIHEELTHAQYIIAIIIIIITTVIYIISQEQKKDTVTNTGLYILGNCVYYPCGLMHILHLAIIIILARYILLNAL